MSEQSEIHTNTPTENRVTADPTPHETALPARFTSEKKSFWKKTRMAVSGLTTAAILTTALAPKSEARDYIPQPVAPYSETAETTVNFADAFKQADRLYSQNFGESRDKTKQVYTLYETIHESIEFSQLDPYTQAEIIHREAYSKLTANKLWFNEKHTVYTEKNAQSLQSNWREINNLFTESIKTNPELSERTINAMIETSKDMIEQAIQLSVERPDLKSYANSILEESRIPLETAFRISPETRYVDDGLFLFPKEDKAKVLTPVIGLIKYTGDIPTNMTTEEALGMVGGTHYNVADEVVPWANAVRKGKIKSTPAEKAFIDYMTKIGIITQDGGIYSANDTADLTMSQPSPMIFSHEIAHMVESNNPGYFKIAQAAYDSMPSKDRALFEEFMDNANPNSPHEQRVREHFAYTHQIGDWHTQAYKVLKK